jgi:hypothetical protein
MQRGAPAQHRGRCGPDCAWGAFSRRAATRLSVSRTTRPAGTGSCGGVGGVLVDVAGILVLFCPKKDITWIWQIGRAPHWRLHLPQRHYPSLYEKANAITQNLPSSRNGWTKIDQARKRTRAMGRLPQKRHLSPLPSQEQSHFSRRAFLAKRKEHNFMRPGPKLARCTNIL